MLATFETFFLVLVIAAMVEAVWETLKMVWQEGKFSFDKLGALAIGLLVAFGSGIDVTELMGVQMKLPYLGIVLTGILISRGANWMHDWIKKVVQINDGNL
jgi:hypothetical protein